MYKKLTILLSALSILIAGIAMTSHTAMAIDVLKGPCSGSASSAAVCQDYSNQTKSGNPNPIFGPGSIIDKVVFVLSIIVGVASIVMVIIGGMGMVFSGGDSKKVSEGSKTVIMALVGLVVAGLAQALVAFVLNRI